MYLIYVIWNWVSLYEYLGIFHVWSKFSKLSLCIAYIKDTKKEKYFTIHSIFFCIEKLNIVLTHNLKLNIFLIVYTYVLMGIWNGLNGDLKKWKFNIIFSKKKKVQWNCHCKWNNQYNFLYIKWHIFLL